jgi:hypothetical protein
MTLAAPQSRLTQLDKDLTPPIRPTGWFWLLLTGASLLLHPAPAAGQMPTVPASAAPPDDGQWTMPAKNYAATPYSALDEINGANVRNLQVAFAFSPASITSKKRHRSSRTLAGYFAAQEVSPLTIEPVQPWRDGAELPMAFDISMGVRCGDNALLQRINDSLERNHAAVAAILAAYCAPVVPEALAVPGSARR